MKTRDWRGAEWKLSQMLMPEAQSDSSKGKPLAKAVANYLADCEVRGLEPSTIRSYRKSLRHLRRSVTAEVTLIALRSRST
jgi:hypothetical protein